MGTQPPPQPRYKSIIPPKPQRTHRRHPHPIAVKLQLIIETSERVYNDVEAIPTTHTGSKRKGGYRADENTLRRNQIAELMELAAAHLSKAQKLAAKLR